MIPRLIFYAVAQRAVSNLPFRGHAREHGNRIIDIVINLYVGFPCMPTMHAADILRESAFPGDWHRQERRVEAIIVEPFADISARRENEAFLAIGHLQRSWTPAKTLADLGYS
ncbi:hypothetical protein [Sphingobium ummariense]